MRFIFAILFAFTLAACDAPANQPQQASPLLSQVISGVVDQANADRGRNLGGGMIVDGARAEGNTVFINFILTEDLDTLRSVPRATLESLLGDVVRADACNDPNISTFVGIGGRMQMNFIDPNRQPIAAVVIDRC